MSWDAIAGQRLAVRLLRQAVASGKLAHAYLFTGPEGVGKRTTALELAKVLHCLALHPERGACDSCASCQKMNATPPVHPDLLVIEPDGRFVKTDQMRELQTTMYVRPLESRTRVVVIDRAERMNAEAGNRVLKLLEEPPEYARFLLLTTNLSGVLPTVVSRCQVVNFVPLDRNDVTRILQQRGIGPEQARLFAALAAGSPGRALMMAQDPDVLRRRDECYDLLYKIGKLDDAALLEHAEAWEKQKEQLDERLEILLVWLRDAMLAAENGMESLMINADRMPSVRELARVYQREGLISALEDVAEMRSRLQRSVNVRLLLDVLLLRLNGIARVNTPV